MKINDLVNLLPDGVLILSDRGEVLFSNIYASKICQTLLKQNEDAQALPPELQQLVEIFQVTETYPLTRERLALLEGEFYIGDTNDIRVRVQLVQPDDRETPCFLVVLEDRQETVRRAAAAEIRKFNLTPREAEVWLWRRTGLTYNEIANKLFVTIDTVKKHLKSIYAKQEAAQWAN
ncbi:LuxR C-terminal-related transcriptional regulator [Vacuolonema iberomarrocanum]|uniref:helix-turn-helix transcriptional regulator n=1 Tax=Vacuolonema iberomarrocanum TaxID=3454632 RepID=UPI0019F33ABD|nr:helix-turn-helix transcriptional regulator [filamentous cyanobacterium LEGE 07170]